MPTLTTITPKTSSNTSKSLHRRVCDSKSRSPNRRRSSRSRSVDRASRILSPSSPRRRHENYNNVNNNNNDSLSSDSDEDENDTDQPQDLRSPKGNKVSTIRRLHNTGNTRATPTTSADTPSNRGQRRRIKYQPSVTKCKTKSNNVIIGSSHQHQSPTPMPHTDDGFRVTTTSGNISTWEMRQKFLREFPNEPVPSDAILRQLYRGDKIAAYERMERYKLEFPGEPVPSDEVLKKLYAIHSGDPIPTSQDDEPSVSSSVDTDILAMATPICREQLIHRQNSESNMTFSSEKGWDDFGKLQERLGNTMAALEEKEEEESLNDAVQRVKSPQMKSPTNPNAHSFHGRTAFLDSSDNEMKWPDHGFGTESFIKPGRVVRRNSDASLTDEKPKSMSALAIQQQTKKKSTDRKKTSGQGRKKDRVKSFHESFDSFGSIRDQKQIQPHGSPVNQKISKNTSPSSKTKSSKATKSNTSTKQRKMGSSSAKRDQDIVSETPLSPNSPSGCVASGMNGLSPVRTTKQDEAWRKREMWKRETWNKQARTRSAPLDPVKKTSPGDDVNPTIGGDPFVALQPENLFDHSFNAFGESLTAEKKRSPPMRSRSSDYFPQSTADQFTPFRDYTKEQNLQPCSNDICTPFPEPPLETGLLRPSKRDIRHGRLMERPRRTRNVHQATTEVQTIDIAAIIRDNGCNSDEDSEGRGIELHMNGDDEPLSPITIATKKPVARSMIARRRG